MSVEIDAAIMGAMQDAGLNESSSDTGDTSVDTSTDTGAVESTDLSTDNTDTPAETPAEGDEAPVVGDSATPEAVAASTLTPEEEAWNKELAEMGIAPPKPGQRDNRIPYSRISKIVKNAKTKWSEKLTADHQAALKEYVDQKTNWDSAEQMAKNDPEGYINLLATVYPDKYGKYRQQPAAAPQAAAKADTSTDDPEPGMDVKYSDGSIGYSPEQYAKVREWDRRQAARAAKEEALAEFNERFGPIEAQYKASEREFKKVQQVRSDIDSLRDSWGADLINDEAVQKDIVAYMDANPKVSLKAATRTVVLGKLQADRNAMRAELLKELEAAPRAAAKTPAAPVKAAATSEQSIDDIIRNAARGIK